MNRFEQPSPNARRLDQPSTVYTSRERCWKCPSVLLRLEPPVQGWRYYCMVCEHLTMTLKDFEASVREHSTQADPAMGHVIASPAKLHIEPIGEDDDA